MNEKENENMDPSINRNLLCTLDVVPTIKSLLFLAIPPLGRRGIYIFYEPYKLRSKLRTSENHKGLTQKITGFIEYRIQLNYCIVEFIYVL